MGPSSGVLRRLGLEISAFTCGANEHLHLRKSVRVLLSLGLQGEIAKHAGISAAHRKKHDKINRQKRWHVSGVAHSILGPATRNLNHKSATANQVFFALPSQFARLGLNRDPRQIRTVPSPGLRRANSSKTPKPLTR